MLAQERGVAQEAPEGLQEPGVRDVDGAPLEVHPECRGVRVPMERTARQALEAAQGERVVPGGAAPIWVKC